MPTPRSAPLHGIWRVIPSPALTEIVAQSGLNFQILDCEHGAYDYSSLLADILACELHQCAPLVRVSGRDNVEAQRCLDLGAHGLVFPQLNHYEDFANAAAMMDYAPNGTRGFNPFVRAGSYGTSPMPVRPWFVPIIETLAAVEAVEAILELDRIDLVYIGSYDLSAQLGIPGQTKSPALERVVERVLSACKRANKPACLMVLNPEDAQAFSVRGVAALVHGVESHRLKHALAGIVQPLCALRLPVGNAGPPPLRFGRGTTPT